MRLSGRRHADATFSARLLHKGASQPASYTLTLWLARRCRLPCAAHWTQAPEEMRDSLEDTRFTLRFDLRQHRALDPSELATSGPAASYSDSLWPRDSLSALSRQHAHGGADEAPVFSGLHAHAHQALHVQLHVQQRVQVRREDALQQSEVSSCGRIGPMIQLPSVSGAARGVACLVQNQICMTVRVGMQSS